MLKIFPVLGYVTMVLLQQLMPTTPNINHPDYMYYIFQTGVAGILFIVWKTTHSSSVKAQKETTEAMGKQFSEIFSQMKAINNDSTKRAAEIFEQMRSIHKDAIAQNNETLNKMFALMQEDVKYKAMIATTTSGFDQKLTNHIKKIEEEM
ncbi:MAG: hypothetical protein K9I99_15105 [Melioribacteraceae bacterium]|nr:hypothetical protein [Melioribacteraceae bacterium]MCF8414553.1 hypothetical protein [Melioribacteraceae bacterium]